MTHPANWTQYQLARSRNALNEVGSRRRLLSEPAAAALDYAAAAEAARGSPLLVYDLGGGTFDVAVLRREGTGFEHADRAVRHRTARRHRLRRGGVPVRHRHSPPTPRGPPRQTRRDWPRWRSCAGACVEAKEACRRIPPPTCRRCSRGSRHGTGDPGRVRADDPPMVARRSRRSRTRWAGRGRPRTDLNAVLCGGSSRIPLVPQMVAERLGVAVRVDAHPKLVMAKGASRLAAGRGGRGGVLRRRTSTSVDEDEGEAGTVAAAGGHGCGGGGAGPRRRRAVGAHPFR